LRASGNAELYIVTADGGPPKRFLTGTTNASNPSWSADGQWIYFNTERPDSIWKIPVEGGAAIRLTSEGESRSWPQESADGKRVFFFRVAGGHGQAWTASVSGGDERFVPGTTDVQWLPARNGIYIINGSPRHFSLNHFDFVTQQAHKIANLPGLFGIGAPAISSDGRTFLFTGLEHGEGDIVLVEGFR
jgi:dipeptidyl aminopeptidase/acylaminoacyl peptidase